MHERDRPAGHHDHPHPQEWATVERGLPCRDRQKRNLARHAALGTGILEALHRIPCPKPDRGKDALASLLEPVALNRLDLKALGERIAARHPDSQTSEIQIRVILINRVNAFGTAEIVRMA